MWHLWDGSLEAKFAHIEDLLENQIVLDDGLAEDDFGRSVDIYDVSPTESGSGTAPVFYLGALGGGQLARWDSGMMVKSLLRNS